MHPTLASLRDTIHSGARSFLDQTAELVSRVDRRKLAWLAIVLAAILFFAGNMLAASVFRTWKADLTSERLFTISPGTKKALASIDEPIDLRVYFSKRLGDTASNFNRSFERVRTLLEQYRSLSGDKLNVTYLDPEPFSDAEDRAVAQGMRGIRLNQQGELGYFGIAGTNSTDDVETIAFFAPDRERFIEYDVTKLIYSLANPKKPAIGMLSTIPLEGGINPMLGMGAPPMPPQMILEQIREVFDIRTLPRDSREIPDDIEVLMLVQPTGLSAETVYSIDQFALRGGKVLLFVDPVPEAQRGNRPGGMLGATDLGEFDKVLKAWGIDFDPGKVAGDIAHARRVQFGGGQRPTVTEYVPWLGLDQRNINQGDVLSASINTINVGSAGILNKAENATTTVQAILATSPQAMQIAAEMVSMAPDPVGLLRSYKQEGKSLTLAARVSGPISSAFPDGLPAVGSKTDGQSEPDKDAQNSQSSADVLAKSSKRAHIASGTLNAVVVADTDMLNDQFWVNIREFLGQQVAIPAAQNAAFVVGALENLSGSEALLTLRGRGITERPFEKVEQIRRASEQQFRDKEQALTAKLQEVQQKLNQLERSGDGQTIILSEKDRKAIDAFRAEMLDVRRQLRNVNLELRRDIDRLDAWLKFLNIAFVPLLIGFGGIGWTAWRRRSVKTS